MSQSLNVRINGMKSREFAFLTSIRNLYFRGNKDNLETRNENHSSKKDIERQTKVHLLRFNIQEEFILHI